MKETLVVESVHLVNYLKVTLTEDSLLLPSITIYVRFRYVQTSQTKMPSVPQSSSRV